MDDRVHRLKPRSPSRTTFAIKPDSSSPHPGFQIKPEQPSTSRPGFVIKPSPSPKDPHPGQRIKPTSSPKHPPGTFVIGKAEAIQEAKERALEEKLRRKEERRESRERLWERVKGVVGVGEKGKVREMEKRGSVSGWEWE